MKRRPLRLGLALGLTTALTACGGGAARPVAAGGTPTTSPGACAPSGSGTTDLTKKPVVVVPRAPAPTATTSIDIVCGTGAEAKAGSVVEAKYVGVLYGNGQEFDSSWKVSADNTFSFTIGQGVIPGFSIGTTGMRVGGRREIIIPPKDGYGAGGSPPVIPPNATLIFVIDLVKVG